MISFHGVTKEYRTHGGLITALKDVDLEIKRGEYCALMGPSGSGKTSLLNIIGCLDKPTNGEYIFKGKRTRELGDRSLSKHRSKELGFVFQSFHLLDRLSVLENVLLPLLYADDYPDEAEKHARDLLQAVELDHRADSRPNTLSGGQQQRVAIARALVNDPSVVLADEPTGNLDSKTTQEILDLFDRIHATGRTLIVVTHDETVADRADRVLHIQDGRIQSDLANAKPQRQKEGLIPFPIKPPGHGSGPYPPEAEASAASARF